MVDMVSERERRDEDIEARRKSRLLETRERERGAVRERKAQRETLETKAGAATLGATGKGTVSRQGVVKNLPRAKTPLSVRFGNDGSEGGGGSLYGGMSRSSLFGGGSSYDNNSFRGSFVSGGGGNGSGVGFGRSVGGVNDLSAEASSRSLPYSKRSGSVGSRGGSGAGTSFNLGFDLGDMGDFPDIHASYHASSQMPNVLTVKKIGGGRFVPVNRAATKIRGGTGTAFSSLGDRSVYF